MSLKLAEDNGKNTQKEVVLNNIDGTNGQNLQSWVHAIVVVTFDIEIGQSVEVLFFINLINCFKINIQFKNQHIFPIDITLTELDRQNICYLSFPDSNSSFLGDIKYHFRIKFDAFKNLNSKAENKNEASSTKAIVCIRSNSYLNKYLYLYSIYLRRTEVFFTDTCSLGKYVIKT